VKNIPSRQRWTALTQQANATIPTLAVGFSRDAGSGRTSVLYSHPHGISEYVVPTSDLPGVMSPQADDTLQADHAAIASMPERPIEWQLLAAGVQRVVSLPVRDVKPGTRFWIGTRDSGAPTAGQLQGLVDVTTASAQLLQEADVASESAEQLRRLDLTAALVPALLEVLDVRDVFDRVSSVSQAALAHDMLTLGLFSDDLKTMTFYAGAAQNSEVGRTFPQPYPAEVTQTRSFDILDDRAVYPLERDRPPTTLGMRSSLRVPLRFGGLTIGGLGFHAREFARYTADDVPVARRLADFVAMGLSHHRLARRLAEEAQRNEELRAANRNLEMLEALLTALIDSDELPGVFEQISAIAAKVLPHDATQLVVCLPDGLHGRVYASTYPDSMPEVQEIPEELRESDWDHSIVDDVSQLAAPRYKHLANLGFLSILRLAIRLDGRFAAALIFVSKARSAFKAADVLIGRRMADRMAVTLARNREIEASSRADEALARAAKLESRVRMLTEELDARTGYRRVIGDSTEWRSVLTQATQVAANETTVLLLGESGTGKEVVARFVHRASPRSNGPFVALNCAALPEHLLEAELFGYERGAFTGAIQSKPGQLEQAAGGTLFLDEVGEMSLPAQAKFLRVLQEREFQRLGGTRVVRSDARIIAATNRDLERAIAQNQFREDLFYRLNVFAIFLPALRDRRADVLPLSDAFLVEIGRSIARPAAGISRDARQRLLDYRWPGNVRELRNILERASILCDGGLITPEHLAIGPSARPMATSKTVGAAGAPGSSAGVPKPAEVASAGDLKSLERDMIEQALQRVRFNKSRAAKELGLTRQQLYLRMKKYGLE
jgi:transcriptional regulator with GAF, ATPase, and Fis domain